MKILVIGANGYLGSAITTALARAGHEVVRTGRTGNGEEGDAMFRVLDLTDPASLISATTTDIDAVVHAGAPLGDWAADRAAVSALLSQLRGRERRLVYVSGAWVLGPSTSSPLDEQSTPRPISLVHGRESVEEAVLTSRACGIVIRPGIVHGHGGGIPSLMTGWAAEAGHGRYVAESSDAPTWAAVHVEDLADLVGLAVTDARSGDILHAVAEEAVDVRDVAAAADLATGGSGVAAPWPVAEASAALGPDFAEALATSQRVTSTRARELGWAPVRPGLVDDVARGSNARLAHVSA